MPFSPVGRGFDEDEDFHGGSGELMSLESSRTGLWIFDRLGGHRAGYAHLTSTDFTTNQLTAAQTQSGILAEFQGPLRYPLQIGDEAV
jgi:hypothetical protein